MAANMYYKYSPEIVREVPVPAGTQSGAAVLAGDVTTEQPGVALTAIAGSTKTTGTSGQVQYTFPSGGIGNFTGSATVAFDGTWVFPVVGFTTSTPRGTRVFAVVSAGAVTGLTLTSSSNTFFGVTDNNLGTGSASAALVRIGSAV